MPKKKSTRADPNKDKKENSPGEFVKAPRDPITNQVTHYIDGMKPCPCGVKGGKHLKRDRSAGCTLDLPTSGNATQQTSAVVELVGADGDEMDLDDPAVQAQIMGLINSNSLEQPDASRELRQTSLATSTPTPRNIDTPSEPVFAPKPRVANTNAPCEPVAVPVAAPTQACLFLFVFLSGTAAAVLLLALFMAAGLHVPFAPAVMPLGHLHGALNSTPPVMQEGLVATHEFDPAPAQSGRVATGGLAAARSAAGKILGLGS